MEAEKIRTTRADSQGVECPVCGAAPGSACVREDAPSHAARHEAAVAAGAPRVGRATADAVVGDAPGPSPWPSGTWSG